MNQLTIMVFNETNPVTGCHCYRAVIVGEKGEMRKMVKSDTTASVLEVLSGTVSELFEEAGE
jgi:hypothetical protein